MKVSRPRFDRSKLTQSRQQQSIWEFDRGNQLDPMQEVRLLKFENQNFISNAEMRFQKTFHAKVLINMYIRVEQFLRFVLKKESNPNQDIGNERLCDTDDDDDDDEGCVIDADFVDRVNTQTRYFIQNYDLHHVNWMISVVEPDGTRR